MVLLLLSWIGEDVLVNPSHWAFLKSSCDRTFALLEGPILLFFRYTTSYLPRTTAKMAQMQPWLIIILVLLGCALFAVTIAGLGRLYIGDTSVTVESRPSDVQASYMREVRERNQSAILHKIKIPRGQMKMQRSYTNYTDYSSADGACKSRFLRI